jgi:hypothetical protein
MRRFSKNLSLLRSLLREIEEAGTLEPGQSKSVWKAVALVERGLRTQDIKAIRKGVEGLAQLFVRTLQEGRLGRRDES